MKEDKRAGIFPEGICFELPELYAVKVARTVLKGEGGGNAADLLNQKGEQQFFKDRSVFYATFPVRTFDDIDPEYFHHEVKLVNVLARSFTIN